MSRKAPAVRQTIKRKVPRQMDRRVRRTRDALGDALVALMQERPFEQIKVQHVLDRAGVARSTFYTHKEDSFLSDCEDFFELMGNALVGRKEAKDRIAPVAEMFSHLAERRDFYAALVGAGKIHDVLEMGQGYFARGIERRLAELPQSREIPGTTRVALAQMFAGAMVALMTWWMNQRKSVAPERIDELYHQTIWRGLANVR